MSATFEALIKEARPRAKRFTLYASDEDKTLDARFSDIGIAIEHRPLPPNGPEPFVTIHDGGAFAGALSLADFEGLLTPPIHRPGDREAVSAGYRALFDVLEETVFSSLDRRQLLGASREIEDRAFRVGHGVLRVSFQRYAAFERQADVYRHLARNGGLDIHVYGITANGESGDATAEPADVADRDLPDIEGLTYHTEPTSEVDRYWVLAFDGGINEQQACALLAQEQDGDYTGFWTYDPETVRTILDEFEALDEESVSEL